MILIPTLLILILEFFFPLLIAKKVAYMNPEQSSRFLVWTAYTVLGGILYALLLCMFFDTPFTVTGLIPYFSPVPLTSIFGVLSFLLLSLFVGIYAGLKKFSLGALFMYWDIWLALHIVVAMSTNDSLISVDTLHLLNFAAFLLFVILVRRHITIHSTGAETLGKF